MGLKDYTDTKNGPQLAVLKHAVIGDRIGEVKIEKGFLKFKGTMTDKHTKEVHHCTMAGCDCEDYKKNKLPCVHTNWHWSTECTKTFRNEDLQENWQD